MSAVAKLDSATPHSLPREEYVLGALLMFPESFTPELSEDLFYRADHRLIFQAIERLTKDGRTHDAISVEAELERVNKLKECGGIAYLGKLVRDQTGKASFSDHVAELQELAAKRAIHIAGVAATRSAADPASAASIAKRIVEKLKPIAEKTQPQVSEVKIVTLSSVKSEPLHPLWPGKLWLGKGALLAGDPGLGKSMLTLDIATRISRGMQWPASVDCAPMGNVILLSAEDDAADTLRPRLEAAGADLSRIHVITEVTERDDKGEPRRKSFRLGRHLPHLERIFAQHKPVLLVIDPITAYMSADVDSHATADVRSDLAPLFDLAQAHRVCVLMVSHLNKATTMQAVYRVTGSVAFVAAARSVFGVVKDPNDKDRRYFLPVKVNLGKDSGGLAYKVVFNGTAPHLEWERDPVDVDIDTLAGTPREKAKQQAEGEVSAWLRDQLRNGPVPATTIWNAANKAEHPERKVRAAIKALGVESAPAGFAGAWHYALPPESDTTPRHTKASDSVPVCKSPGNYPESVSRAMSKSAKVSGITQSRTESNTFLSQPPLHDSDAFGALPKQLDATPAQYGRHRE